MTQKEEDLKKAKKILIGCRYVLHSACEYVEQREKHDRLFSCIDEICDSLKKVEALTSRPDEMKGEEEDTEEDANKLNLLADWFDMGDKEMSSPGSVPEVQDDLRRIAKYLASRALTEKG